MKNLNKKGITLIALIITIIVLLILAGVSIATLAGDNGILIKASETKKNNSHATVKDAISLAYSEYQIEINTSSSKKVKELTKVASTEIVKIQGKEENSLGKKTMSFFDFLIGKNYIYANGIVNIENLVGETLNLENGNKTDSKDVYKIEEDTENNIYVLKYYDEKGRPETLWQVHGVNF